MSESASTTAVDTEPQATDKLTALLRQYDVERFYYDEAALPDAHRYEDWVALFTDDTRYFVPIRRIKRRRGLADEFTRPGQMAFFDENKVLLDGCVKKLLKRRSWSEVPPSRTRRFIANVRVIDDDGHELVVESNFHVW